MQKTYNELRITPSGDYALFVDVILSLWDEAIEEDGQSIILRSEEPLDMVRFGVESFATSLSQIRQKPVDIAIEYSVKENEDWIEKYKKAIDPIHVGDFYIHPSWVEDAPEKHNIIIDPALAFGSGHHETTYGCLLLLQKYVKAQDTLLDVGCGSGILGLCATKLGASVDLCDTDEQAIQSTEDNFKLNKANYHTLWKGSVQKRTHTYDVVLANIIADVLIMLSSDLQSAVRENGILILSGILDKYVDKVEAKFASMKLVEKYQRKEWFTLVLQRN